MVQYCFDFALDVFKEGIRTSLTSSNHLESPAIPTIFCENISTCLYLSSSSSRAHQLRWLHPKRSRLLFQKANAENRTPKYAHDASCVRVLCDRHRGGDLRRGVLPRKPATDPRREVHRREPPSRSRVEKNCAPDEGRTPLF